MTGHAVSGQCSCYRWPAKLSLLNEVARLTALAIELGLVDGEPPTRPTSIPNGWAAVKVAQTIDLDGCDPQVERGGDSHFEDRVPLEVLTVRAEPPTTPHRDDQGKHPERSAF